MRLLFVALLSSTVQSSVFLVDSSDVLQIEFISTRTLLDEFVTEPNVSMQSTYVSRGNLVIDRSSGLVYGLTDSPDYQSYMQYDASQQEVLSTIRAAGGDWQKDDSWSCVVSKLVRNPTSLRDMPRKIADGKTTVFVDGDWRVIEIVGDTMTYKDYVDGFQVDIKATKIATKPGFKPTKVTVEKSPGSSPKTRKCSSISKGNTNKGRASPHSYLLSILL